jgi:hypothetical protein
MILGARLAREFSLAACCFFCATSAFAHGEDQSSLSLRVGGSRVSVEWRIALRDLEHAIGLDANGDGNITWGELRAQHGAIAEYALARLSIRSRGNDCPAGTVGHWVDKYHDGAYAVLRFTANCSGNIEAMDISYSLLFDLDRQHMGVLRLQHRGRTATTVFDVGRTARHFELTGRQITIENIK